MEACWATTCLLSHISAHLICKVKHISLKDHKHGENTGQEDSLHLQISDSCLIQDHVGSETCKQDRILQNVCFLCVYPMCSHTENIVEWVIKAYVAVFKISIVGLKTG